MKTEQEKKEERYLISETAKLVGVESHVLRYWEEELKLPIRRNELGHRYYTKEDVEQFREIKKLKEQGLQLKAIRTVLTAEGSMQILMPVSEREVFQMGGRAQAEAPMEKVSAKREAKELDAGEKAVRLQMLLHSLVSQAVRENNEELTRQLRETITKEMDYQFRRSISAGWMRRCACMRGKKERERRRAAAGRQEGSRRLRQRRRSSRRPFIRRRRRQKKRRRGRKRQRTEGRR